MEIKHRQSPDPAAIFPELETALSSERFGTYLVWADNDRQRAIELYALNTALCECLYTSLHMLEITLRNRVHAVMTDIAGYNWFDDSQFRRNLRQSDMLARARADLARNRKEETPSAIVAALTFGYWTAMLGKEYETLWQTDLHKIAHRPNGKTLRRKDLTRPLGPIRLLRNRIAHHEPILHWDVRKHHASIIELIRWVSSVAADWCETHDRFPAVHPVGPIMLAARAENASQLPV